MNARPENLAPDLARLRKEYEVQKQRVLEGGDEEAIRMLAELERKAADASFWVDAPSVVEQLSDHLKRLGIK